MDIKAGDLLQNRYKIVKVLGKGGQGAVYLAEDKNVFDQKKAVKELLNLARMDEAEKKMAMEMFNKEGAFLAMLDHPGLPKISDKFSQDGKCYLIMDFVEGSDLEKRLNGDPKFFTEVKVIELALALCDILHYMHNQKPPIVFRDLKPENIILTTKDEKLKLIDFGTARFYDSSKKKDTVQIGTIGYAAPEQYSGTTDHRADIYAFGAMLHHLLTEIDPKQRKPFEAEGIPVRSVKPDLSEDIEMVIAKALKSDRNKRYATIADMKIDLLRCSSVRVCNTCGAICGKTAKFCPKCGNKIQVTEMLKQGKKARFLLEPHDDLGMKNIPVTKDVLQFGRNPSNDVVINDSSVSGTHAILKKDGNEFTVIDLGSTNGTWVNGKRIKASNLVKPEWEIKFGNAVFYLREKK